MDSFMHAFALGELANFEPSRTGKLAAKAETADNPALAALLLEAATVHEKFRKLRGKLPPRGELAPHSPLPLLRREVPEDADLHGQWMKLFIANLGRHELLPAPEEASLRLLHERPREREGPQMAEIAGRFKAGGEGGELRPPETVAVAVIDALQREGLRCEAEKRHVASLSPVALLREWLIERRVSCGGLDYELSGKLTAYGRGMDLASARASYLMEIAERLSSTATIKGEEVPGYAAGHELRFARRSELLEGGERVLDPNELCLDAPYHDEPLAWLRGFQAAEGGGEPLLVPAQFAFMFCNLDEPDFYQSQGSTGLGAGETPEFARLSALMEVLERDAEAVTPYHPEACFRLEADNPEVAALLKDHAENGVQAAVQELRSDFGAPCYKAFAVYPTGKVAKGTGAGPDGPRAALSALTETPYPYPGGVNSRPLPEDMAVRKLEDLPNYSTGSPAGDLEMAEELLRAHGKTPVYIDLTRSKAGLPVFRALVPGLRPTADHEPGTRTPRRLFDNYLRLYGGKG
jgi:ribosomal protein S12 methylthiotransferase accessory factor YcaO